MSADGGIAIAEYRPWHSARTKDIACEFLHDGDFQDRIPASQLAGNACGRD
jgi:hypothetical protein